MNQKINFPELIDLMAHKQQCSKRDAERFLRELMAIMTDVISEGETLKINSLGTFKSVWVEDRASVNVQTGESNIIPGHYKLTFTPVKQVRDAINEPFSCFMVEVLPDEAPILNTGGDGVNETTDDESPADVDTLHEDAMPVAHDEKVTDENTHSMGDNARGSATHEHDEKVADENAATSDVTGLDDDKIVEEEEVLQPLIPQIDDKTEPAQPHQKLEEDGNEDDNADDGDVDSEESSDEVNEQKKKISRTYRHGLLTGIVLATTVCALVVLSFYLYLTRYNEHVPDDGSIALVADTVDVVSEQVDTITMKQDTIQVDSINVQPQSVAEDIVATVQTSQTDTICSGVFLTTMSLRHYGHKAFWVYIYEENKNIISNPDLIPVGTVVVIPPPEKYGISPSDTVSINKALTIADEIKAQQKR